MGYLRDHGSRGGLILRDGITSTRNRPGGEDKREGDGADLCMKAQRHRVRI